MVGRFPCLFINQTAKSDKKYWIAAGKFNLGIAALETEYVKLVITPEGEIEKHPCKVTASKYPLSGIREMLEKNEKFMRIGSDDEYSKLSQEEVKGRLFCLNKANMSEELDKLCAQLKKLERTQHWLLWHDHAGIGSTGILLFLVHGMYNPAIHLTREEYLAKSGTTEKIDVQAEME